MQATMLISLLCMLSTAFAVIPLSIHLPGSARKCYFVRAHTDDAKIRVNFAVMTGGDYAIDATLSRPDGSVAQSVQHSEGDDWLLAARSVGDYELCFNNPQGDDKTVQFEYQIDTNSIEAVPPRRANDEYTNQMYVYVDEIDNYASEISRKLLYLKSRNMRNEETVKSTASRVRWFSFLGLLSIVGMAVFNVVIVQLFFKGSRRNVV